MERASALWTHSAKRNPSRNRSCAIASAVAGRSGGSTPWMKNYCERRFDRVTLFGCGGQRPSYLALWHWTECTAGGGNTALIRSGWLVGSPAKTTTGCTDSSSASDRSMHRDRRSTPQAASRPYRAALSQGERLCAAHEMQRTLLAWRSRIPAQRHVRTGSMALASAGGNLSVRSVSWQSTT